MYSSVKAKAVTSGQGVDNNTAWSRQRDLSDVAALSRSNYTIYIQIVNSNDTPNEPSHTQTEDDNSLVCLLPRLTDFHVNVGHF